MSMEVVAPIRNLSVRAKDIRHRLMRPENGIESTEREVISSRQASRLMLTRLTRLAEEEKKQLKEARLRRGQELVLAYQRAVSQWIAEAGTEPAVPFLPRITITQVIAAVCAQLNIAELEMISARRSADVVYPRMIGMCMARWHTPCSLPMIGQRFGGRDHTTVMHAIHSGEKKLAECDRRFAADIAAIKQRLGVA